MQLTPPPTPPAGGVFHFRKKFLTFAVMGFPLNTPANLIQYQSNVAPLDIIKSADFNRVLSNFHAVQNSLKLHIALEAIEQSGGFKPAIGWSWRDQYTYVPSKSVGVYSQSDTKLKFNVPPGHDSYVFLASCIRYSSLYVDMHSIVFKFIDPISGFNTTFHTVPRYGTAPVANETAWAAGVNPNTIFLNGSLPSGVKNATTENGVLLYVSTFTEVKLTLTTNKEYFAGSGLDKTTREGRWGIDYLYFWTYKAV